MALKFFCDREECGREIKDEPHFTVSVEMTRGDESEYTDIPEAHLDLICMSCADEIVKLIRTGPIKLKK